MANSTIKAPIQKTAGYMYYGVYPSGKVYNQTYTRLTIPFLNPYNISPTLGEVYVYDSDGNFTQITGCTVAEYSNVAVTVNIPFTSSHAGKMIRIAIS